jgi:hypothetical protein
MSAPFFPASRVHTTVFDAYDDVSAALARGATRARLGTPAGPGRRRVEDALARATPRARATRGDARAVVDMAVCVARSSPVGDGRVGVYGGDEHAGAEPRDGGDEANKDYYVQQI